MNHTYRKFGPTLVVLILLYFAYIILKPFLMPMITVSILSYLFYPIYKKISSKIKSRGWSAVIMILLIFLIFIVPISYITGTLINEIPDVFENIVYVADHAYLVNDFSFDLTNLVSTIASKILIFLQNSLGAIPGHAFNISLGLFFMFFFFKEGPNMIHGISEILPFGKKRSLVIFEKVKDMIDAVVYGQLITAIIQFVLLLLAYSILGVKAPIFWAITTFFFSMIPVVGPAIIYVPISAIMIIKGFVGTNTILAVKGIILLVFGFGIVSSVDNLVKPLVISGKVKVHPALILIGVIGGIIAYGMIGLVLGPMILVLLLTIFETYKIPKL